MIETYVTHLLCFEVTRHRLGGRLEEARQIETTHHASLPVHVQQRVTLKHVTSQLAHVLAMYVSLMSDIQ